MGQAKCQIVQIHVEGLLRIYDFIDIGYSQLSADDAAAFAGIAFHKHAHRKVSQLTCKNPVIMRRVAAALNMTQNGNARIYIAALPYSLADLFSGAGTLCNDNNTVPLA